MAENNVALAAIPAQSIWCPQCLAKERILLSPSKPRNVLTRKPLPM